MDVTKIVIQKLFAKNFKIIVPPGGHFPAMTVFFLSLKSRKISVVTKNQPNNSKINLIELKNSFWPHAKKYGGGKL